MHEEDLAGLHAVDRLLRLDHRERAGEPLAVQDLVGLNVGHFVSPPGRIVFSETNGTETVRLCVLFR